ncbi:MAG: hypothetical protein HQ547_04375 [Candidatus Omnitrophica bacterium]|nr:hypothetical protein [Candidatus Omnitrophota bacterium]
MKTKTSNMHIILSAIIFLSILLFGAISPIDAIAAKELKSAAEVPTDPISREIGSGAGAEAEIPEGIAKTEDFCKAVNKSQGLSDPEEPNAVGALVREGWRLAGSPQEKLTTRKLITMVSEFSGRPPNDAILAEILTESGLSSTGNEDISKKQLERIMNNPKMRPLFAGRGMPGTVLLPGPVGSDKEMIGLQTVKPPVVEELVLGGGEPPSAEQGKGEDPIAENAIIEPIEEDPPIVDPHAGI